MILLSHIIKQFNQTKQCRKNFSNSTKKEFKPIKGLLAATFTKFTENGMGIDTQNLNLYADDLLQQGVFIQGTSGESLSMTVKERKEYLEAWMKCTNIQNGNLKVIVHIGATSLLDVIELAQHASQFNIQGIAVTAPSYFKCVDEESVVDWLEAISKAVPNEFLYYYHFPGMNSFNGQVHKIFAIAQQRNVNQLVGAKFTFYDFEDFHKCCDMGKNMLIGYDEKLYTALEHGADGAVGIGYNFAGILHSTIYNEYVKGNLEKSCILQRKSVELFEIINKVGAVLPVSKQLNKVLRSIDNGELRLPLRNLTIEQKNLIEQVFLQDFQRCVRI